VDIKRDRPRSRKKYVYGGIAIAALALTTLALSRLERAAPTVERGTVWVDKVKRGPMLRQVRGPGTLVPERIRWVTAVTAGRVERRHVEPGQEVDSGSVLLELTNPDVDLQLVEAQSQLTAAQAQLANLQTNLATQRLNQQTVVANAYSQYMEAKRTAEVSENLAKRSLIAENELENARDRAKEQETRYQVEQERLKVMQEGERAQLIVQRTQIASLREVIAFRRRQQQSMRVVAGAPGVVQEISLEVGQWANPGATLARVVQPGKLKAVLRIPETQAKDVVIGQPAQIDTRNGIVEGRVSRIDPAAQNGTVTVDVALTGPLPQGARPDLSVDGTVEIERLDNVLYVGRPAYGQANSTVELFKLVNGGKSAVRAKVKLGVSSVNTIEILEGLVEGEEVILSDMSNWDSFERVRLQ